MCEFSLSYDGGKNFHVIATYSKTCPDAAYKWPVRIPDNVPSCNKPGNTLLSGFCLTVGGHTMKCEI